MCGIAYRHHSRTCLSLEENRVRLASLAGRKDDLLDLGRRLEVTLLIGMRQQHQKNTQLISTTVSQAVNSMLYVTRTFFFAINIACVTNDLYTVDC
jgi:hypothetical protein